MCWLFIYVDGFGQYEQDVFSLVLLLLFFVCLLWGLFFVCLLCFCCCCFCVCLFVWFLGGRNFSLVYSLPVVFIYFGTAENLEQTKPIIEFIHKFVFKH